VHLTEVGKRTGGDLRYLVLLSTGDRLQREKDSIKFAVVSLIAQGIDGNTDVGNEWILLVQKGRPEPIKRSALD